MLRRHRDDLITCAPVDRVDAEVHAVGGVLGEGHFVGPYEAGSGLAAPRVRLSLVVEQAQTFQIGGARAEVVRFTRGLQNIVGGRSAASSFQVSAVVCGECREHLAGEARVCDGASPSGIGMPVLYNSLFMQNGNLVKIGRRRRRARKKSKLWQRLRSALLLLCFVSILGVVGMVASAVSTYQAFAANMPDLDDYHSTELAQTSLIYDTNGNIVDQLYGVQNRFVVPLEEVDPTLRQAIISIEDHRYYEHRGISVDFAVYAQLVCHLHHFLEAEIQGQLDEDRVIRVGERLLQCDRAAVDEVVVVDLVGLCVPAHVYGEVLGDIHGLG